MLSRFLDALVSAVAPIAGMKRAAARRGLALINKRGYGGARGNGGAVFANSRASDGSADSELGPALPVLRMRSRQLYRDNATTRAAVEALVAHVVGTGIDVEPDTGKDADDKKLRDVLREWSEACDVTGRLSLWELERQAYRAEMLGGDSIWRICYLSAEDAKARGLALPVAIQALETDQLASAPINPIPKGHDFRAGVELDAIGRPFAYHILDGHPGDTAHAYEIGVNGSASHANGKGIGEKGGPLTQGGKARGSVIPAREIIHSFEALRPGQTRGEPILAPVLATISQEAELVEAELTSAKIGAAFAAVITSASSGSATLYEGDADTNKDGAGNEFTKLEAGLVARLAEGESIEQVGSTRPSQQIAPFRKMLRGDIAAGLRIRSQDLDKDYSGANYSSMRCAQLDLRRHIEPIQNAFGRRTVGELYRRIFDVLATAAGVRLGRTPEQIRKQARFTIHPDGFPYVDPEKDIKASIGAIAAGMSTWKDELGTRGKDFRKVQEQLKAELTDELREKIFNAQLNVQFGDVPGLLPDMGGGAPAAPDSTKPDDDDDEKESKNE